MGLLVAFCTAFPPPPPHAHNPDAWCQCTMHGPPNLNAQTPCNCQMHQALPPQTHMYIQCISPKMCHPHPWKTQALSEKACLKCLICGWIRFVLALYLWFFWWLWPLQLHLAWSISAKSVASNPWSHFYGCAPSPLQVSKSCKMPLWATREICHFGPLNLKNALWHVQGKLSIWLPTPTCCTISCLFEFALELGKFGHCNSTYIWWLFVSTIVCDFLCNGWQPSRYCLQRLQPCTPSVGFSLWLTLRLVCFFLQSPNGRLAVLVRTNQDFFDVV